MSCISADMEKFQCDACPVRLSDDVDACPARWFFQHFGDKWTLPALGCLANGPLRYSQFRKMLAPISERMLILTLKKLEESGFIARGQADERPSQNIYRLTPLGRSLLEHVGDLFHWMNANAPAILETFETRTAPRAVVTSDRA